MFTSKLPPLLNLKLILFAVLCSNNCIAFCVLPSEIDIVLSPIPPFLKLLISAYKTPSVEFIKSLLPALLHTSAFRVTVVPLVGM
jgi:hypothetical protein